MHSVSLHFAPMNVGFTFAVAYTTGEMVTDVAFSSAGALGSSSSLPQAVRQKIGIQTAAAMQSERIVFLTIV